MYLRQTTCAMFFRIFLNKQNINVCAFKETASMLLRRTRNDKPRTRPSGRFPTRAMRGTPAFCLLRIDVRPRECKCEIVVDPFFPRLSHRTVSARTFLSPHTCLAINLRFSFISSPPSSSFDHCYAEYRELAPVRLIN